MFPFIIMSQSVQPQFRRITARRIMPKGMKVACRAGFLFPWLPLLPIQQAAHIPQQFVRAYRAVAMLIDQPLRHLVNSLQLLLIRRFRRGRDFHDILQIGEQLLLDRFPQPLVAANNRTFCLYVNTRKYESEFLRGTLFSHFRKRRSAPRSNASAAHPDPSLRRSADL